MAQALPYIRLPGRGSPRGSLISATRSSGTLWLGPDHLLNVVNTGYTERYKRFYFSGIQAFIIVRDSRRLTVNIFLGLFALLTLAGTILSLRGDLLGLAIFLLCVLAVWLLWLWGNTALGPTCRCYVRTAVQVEELPALCRVRRARTVIERVRPLIEESQAGLVPIVTLEDLQDRGLDAVLETSASAPVRASGKTPPPPLDTLAVASEGGARTPSSKPPGMISFGVQAALLLAHAFVFGMIAQFNNVFLSFCAMGLTLAFGGMALPALVHRGRRRGLKPGRLLAWSRIVLGYAFVCLTVLYVLFIAAQVTHPGTVNVAQVFRHVGSVSGADSVWVALLCAIVTTCSAGLGLFGFARILAETKSGASSRGAGPPPLPSRDPPPLSEE